MQNSILSEERYENGVSLKALCRHPCAVFRSLRLNHKTYGSTHSIYNLAENEKNNGLGIYTDTKYANNLHAVAFTYYPLYRFKWCAYIQDETLMEYFWER